MDFDTFSVFLRKLFTKLAIDKSEIMLNGSYANSYFASDIDLYENTQGKAHKVVQKVRKLKKSLGTTAHILEVKTQLKNGQKERLKEKLSTFTIENPDEVSFVKVDMIIKYFVFPIEVSMIYDINPEELTLESGINMFLDDIQELAPKNLYKAVKRMHSIARMLGYNDMFNDVLNDGKLGVIYLSFSRLETLKIAKQFMTTDKYNTLKDYIKEDLRKYGLNLSDNLVEAMNEEVQKYL